MASWNHRFYCDECQANLTPDGPQLPVYHCFTCPGPERGQPGYDLCEQCYT
eukprot:gene9082-8197_t